MTDQAPSDQALIVTRPRDHVAVVTLNRPQTLNALTEAMFLDLEREARELGRDASVRVVVITGAGRGFCSGYDLADAKGLPDLTPQGMLDRQELAMRALLAVRELRVPVIAAVNGAAAGGGLSLALAADIRLASPSASFTASFTKIGLSAGDLGVSWLLPRLIGPGAAAEIAYTGRTVRAEESAALGLVNSVVDGDVLSAALDLAEQIAANSPAGVRLSKRALQANLEVPSYAAALELENRGQTLLTRTDDMAEALAAFLEKRPAEFANR
ncbi:MAG: enoyl-CoA hydratase/isomerase family protein [Humibacter sp.]